MAKENLNVVIKHDRTTKLISPGCNFDLQSHKRTEELLKVSIAIVFKASTMINLTAIVRC